MTVWFTADTHFGHKKIIEFTGRPFKHVQDMNEKMFAYWNDRVRPADTVYHLGDFSFMHHADTKKLVGKLHGQKFLILGNHDKDKRIKNAGFQQVTPYKEITIGEQKIILMHYAMKVWNKAHYGSWQLHGHSHGTLPRDYTMRQLDVGVDCWNFAPISYDHVAKEMEKHSYKAVDHHKDRT